MTDQTGAQEHAAATTTVPAGRRARFGLAAAAAAAVALLLVAGVVLGALQFGGHAPSRAAGAPAGSAAGAGSATPASRLVVTRSWRDYTPATLARFVPAIVAGEHLARAGRFSTAPAPPAGKVAAGGAALDRLATSPAVLRACVQVVSAGGPLLNPLAADLGYWEGGPAAVFVLPVPGHPASADVFVEGPACANGRDATLYYERVARPAGS